MAGVSNDVVMQSASKEQGQNDDVPSSESIPEDGKSCSKNVLEHISTSSSTATEPIAVESTEFIESKPDGSSSLSLSEKSLHDAPNISEGSPKEIASENQINTTLRRVNSEDKESIQSTVTQEIGSNKEIQRNISEETESIKITESDHSGKALSSKLSQEAISTEIQLTQATNLKDPTRLLYSSDSSSKNGASVTTTNQNVPKDLNPSAVPEIQPEKFPRLAADLSNCEKNSDSSGAAAEDTDIFNSLQNTEEYKNGTRLKIVNQSGSGGFVVASPTTSCAPIFPKLEIPPILPSTMDSSMDSVNPITSSNDSETPMDMHSKMSLSAMESALAAWVNRGLDRVFNRARELTSEDFLKYTENEFKCVLDIFKQMKLRIDTLLTAADNLPDPPSTLSQRRKVRKYSTRDDVKEAGMNVHRRLELLEADANGDYERFVLLCLQNSNRNDEEFDPRQLEITALNIISNSYVRVSERFMELNLIIEIFRDNIRDFCSELERLL
ncbi:uncharacterized protein LOC129957193 [Argiope bruennichi]|uniref:uncharacterized protein LOC129957193 n=1 Tax=Argiope bruennichi TaxID=94029 RepID=UPI002494EA57|nr:uncharacterized protein LOC129957193 [Argiope bruennichi]